MYVGEDCAPAKLHADFRRSVRRLCYCARHSVTASFILCCFGSLLNNLYSPIHLGAISSRHSGTRNEVSDQAEPVSARDSHVALCSSAQCRRVYCAWYKLITLGSQQPSCARVETSLQPCVISSRLDSGVALFVARRHPSAGSHPR